MAASKTGTAPVRRGACGVRRSRDARRARRARRDQGAGLLGAGLAPPPARARRRGRLEREAAVTVSARETRCERTRTWAALAPDGELAVLERRLLDAHLANCLACRSFADDVAAIAAELRAAAAERTARLTVLPAAPMRRTGASATPRRRVGRSGRGDGARDRRPDAVRGRRRAPSARARERLRPTSRRPSCTRSGSSARRSNCAGSRRPAGRPARSATNLPERALR